MSIAEYHEKKTGKKFKKVQILPYEEIFTGENLDRCRMYDSFSEKGSCHFNAGQIMRWHELEGWEVSFCEGLYKGKIPHCWNKVTNKATGESYYVDFTIGPGTALLIEEWDKDIIRMFDARRQAFVPFESGYYITEKNKKARAIFEKHYPKFDHSF